MLSKGNPLLKPLLAGMTLLLAFQAQEVLIMAAVILASVLLVTHFFKLAKPLFPESLLKTSVLLTVAALFQIVTMITGRPAFWIVSLGFLLEWDDLEPNHLGAKPLPFLRRLILFAAVVLICLFIREAAQSAGISIFKHPAGLVILLGVFSWVVTQIDIPLVSFVRKKRRRQ